VPVSHEEVTIEREAITKANRGDAVAGADLSEEEHEVTLTEERAVVDRGDRRAARTPSAAGAYWTGSASIRSSFSAGWRQVRRVRHRG
jgi:hypothetical protein